MDTGETVHLILMIILVPLSVGSFGAVAWWFARQKSGAEADAQRVDAIWTQHEVWGDETCRQIINRQVAAGMTPPMVKLTWGHPAAVNRADDSTQETWHYLPDRTDQPARAVTFKNGRVDDWEGQFPDAEAGINPYILIAALLGLALFLSAVTVAVIFIVR